MGIVFDVVLGAIERMYGSFVLIKVFLVMASVVSGMSKSEYFL